MKIMLVCSYYPPHLGGMERYASELVNELSKNDDWEIVVVTTNDLGMDEVEKKGKLTIYRLGYKTKLSNTPFSIGWFRKVNQILKTEKPDLINIHTPVPGLGDVASFLAKNIPTVVTYHAGSMKKGVILPDILISAYENLLMPRMLNKAKKIVCSSDFVKNNFLEKYKKKSQTIPPGTNDEVFKPSLNKISNPTILFVAGLNKADSHKGILNLLNVAIKIPNARLLIVGDGDMRNEYEKMVKISNLKNRTKFLGWLRGEKLVEAYQKANIFVLPTRNDSYPTVILEAMACGLPVISTKVGSIAAMVEDGITGYLIEPNDNQELLAKIKYLVKNSQTRESFGKAGRAKVEIGFQWKGKAKEYKNIFEDILKNKKEIVQVCAYYPPHIGGLEFVAQTTAELLAENGYRVKVLTSNLGFKGNEELIKNNLEILPLKSFEFAHTAFAPGLVWELFKINKNSIIHLHLAQAFFPELVMWISKLRGIPYVAHFHLDVEPSGKLGSLFLFYKKIFWRRILGGAKKVIICSIDQKETLINKFGVYPNNIIVIGNSVKELFYTKEKYQPSKDMFRLLFVGRLTIQKRAERLIEAMREVKVPAKLTIVGDGEDREKLEALVKKYNLKNVDFVGAKSSEEIAKIHQKNDLLLMSSDREGGTPLVAIEAMANKLPVIGTNVSGVANFLKNVGIVVDEPFAKNIATEINQLWGNPDKLIELSAKSRIKAEFYRPTNFIKQVIEVYERI